MRTMNRNSIEIGFVAKRCPKTGAFINEEPIFLESTPKLLGREQSLNTEICRLFAIEAVKDFFEKSNK